MNKIISSPDAATGKTTATKISTAINKIHAEVYNDFATEFNKISKKKIHTEISYSFISDIINATTINDSYQRDFEKHDEFINDIIETQCKGNRQASIEFLFSLLNIETFFIYICSFSEEYKIMKEEVQFFKSKREQLLMNYNIYPDEYGLTQEDIENYIKTINMMVENSINN